jgi:hypothetical protein
MSIEAVYTEEQPRLKRRLQQITIRLRLAPRTA